MSRKPESREKPSSPIMSIMSDTELLMMNSIVACRRPPLYPASPSVTPVMYFPVIMDTSASCSVPPTWLLQPTPPHAPVAPLCLTSRSCSCSCSSARGGRHQDLTHTSRLPKVNYNSQLILDHMGAFLFWTRAE